MKVFVENRTTTYRLDRRGVMRIIAGVLKAAKVGRVAGLGFVFLDDRSIRRLNRRYMKHDRPTDVLCFRLDEGGRSSRGILGEIYISIDRAAVQSKRFGASPGEELVRYIIHGVLHLVGYDDRTRRERVRMSHKEDWILAWLSRSEKFTRVLTRR